MNGEHEPLITNNAVVLGLLLAALAFVFVTSSSENKFWKKFYTYCPALLLCYFIPALMNWPLGLISGEGSQLYFVASRYLLPTSLVFLCLSIDIKGIVNLGFKAVAMFLAATVGIVLGGPIAILLVGTVAPEVIEQVGSDQLWRGLSTVAGTWIGGGANQAAMKEIYEVTDDTFTSMLVVDIIVSNIWMGVLLYGVSISGKLDRWLKADTSAIEELKEKVESYRAGIVVNPTTTQLFVLLAVGFGATAIAHFGSDIIQPFMMQFEEGLKAVKLNSLTSSFFWLVVLATTIGFGLSFTPAKKLEGYGASKIGSIFIYILVATIGMKMNILAVKDNLGLFAIGLIWMSVHVIVLLIVAKIIRAPYFFVAVGSQANVGGAASAPVVASAFSSTLAPVGVLLAVLGYALGTYGAIMCAELMRVAAMP